MDSIKNIQVIKKHSFSWDATHIVYIKNFSWESGNLNIICFSQDRRLNEIWPDNSKEFLQIEMNFKGVSSFELNITGQTPHQITGFTILDVSANGWEKINFEIDDYENDSISFFCEHIEIISAERLMRLNELKRLAEEG